MSLLEVEALGLSINGTPILGDVSFAVEAGQIVGIIGESGSGKSLTALSVMQLLPEGAEATGRVTLGGQEMLQLEEAALCGVRGNEVGMVFQEPMTALNPIQTIGAQVAETIRIHEKVSR
nr:ATP-binding cassette domain-containing protein [Roseobacter sp.]